MHAFIKHFIGVGNTDRSLARISHKESFSQIEAQAKKFMRNAG